MYCPECGHDLADDATYCPECGSAVEPAPESGPAEGEGDSPGGAEAGTGGTEPVPGGDEPAEHPARRMGDDQPQEDQAGGAPDSGPDGSAGGREPEPRGSDAGREGRPRGGEPARQQGPRNSAPPAEGGGRQGQGQGQGRGRRDDERAGRGGSPASGGAAAGGRGGQQVQGPSGTPPGEAGGGRTGGASDTLDDLRATMGTYLAGVPVGEGIIYGAVTFVVGYLLTFLLYVVEAGSRGVAITDGYGALTFVGWLYYGAHNVGVSGGLGNVLATTYEFAVSTTVPSLVFYLVPPLVLFLSGWVLARNAPGGLPATPRDGAVVGAAVVIGYLPVALLAALTVFSVNSTGPQLAMTVLVAGLVYPGLFGAAGGAVASR